MNPVKHVAIIMDGNGRWGIKYKGSRNKGHTAGLKTIENIIEESLKQKIKYLTLYTFSTENWKRPIKEVDGLIKLFSESISRESKKIHSNNIKLKFIGDTSIFTEPLQLKIKVHLIEINNQNSYLSSLYQYLTNNHSLL